MNETPENIVDRLTAGLMAEFAEHYRAYSELEPGADRHVVFEAWVIQKIAGIHYVLEDRLAAQIDRNPL